MQSIGTFSGYLTPSFPSQIVLDVTEFCNLSCIHCPYVSLVKPKGKARQNFPEQLHKKLVDEITAIGTEHCRFVRYTGEGETLLHPQIMDFLSDMARTGVPVSVTTNGLLLTEQRCNDLIASGIKAIDISIDAFKPETYAQIRVGGALQDVKEGVNRLIEMNKAVGAPLKIMTSFIHQDLNAGEDHLFQDYWRGQGVDFVFIRNLHSCAGFMQDTARKLWAAAQKPRKPCLYPWERLLIKPDGLVDYCPSDWKHGSLVGDYAKQSVHEIWQGPAMQELRAAHVSSDFTNHPLCKDCPDWSTTYWPDEGRTYATAMHEATGQKQNDQT